MAESFITVLNGVITGKHHGDINADFFGTPYYGHGKIPVPFHADIAALDRVDYYDSEWKRKSDAELVDEGIVPMPEGYVREGDTIRRMDHEERVLAGLDAPDPGTVVENGRIVPLPLSGQVAAGLASIPEGYMLRGEAFVEMGMDEKFAAALVTEEEYCAYLSDASIAGLNRRLAALQTPEALAQAEIDGEYAAGRRARLAALLAVKQQPGWPLLAVWPEAEPVD